MSDYICKPVRIADLQNAIEKWGSRRTATPPSPKLEYVTGDADALDLSILEELKELPDSEGIGMLDEMLALFFDTAPKRIEQIKASANDAPRLAFNSHALKSMSLHLGAKRLVALAQKLELCGASKQLEGAATLIGELESCYVQTKIQLKHYRGKQADHAPKKPVNE
jgi:HPt (histidine-containing phosphotransfer) domain-containing protein